MMNAAYLRRGTVVDALHTCVRETPERRLYTFVGGDGRDRDSLNGRELLEAAAGLAAHLRGERGFKPGERLLLCYPPSLDFVKALFGCMLGGIIPVPVAPPNPMRGGYEVQALAAIAANSGARAILTNGEYQRARKLAAIQRLLRKDEKWPKLPWHRTDNVAWDQDVPIPDQRPAMNDLALLQYTSGSTAAPKGVMITHGNIAHQIWLNWHELGIDDQSRGVSWVPHFHDMGLISTILNAVINNGHLYMLSPLSFLRRPAVWFEVMSRVGATHTAAPAFAYSLAVRKTTAAERRRVEVGRIELPS